MPSATARTERVNSSREPVRATRASIQGTTLGPIRMAMTAKAATLDRVTASSSAIGMSDGAWPWIGLPPSTSAKAGSSTSASTIARSSTISQPTATRPLGLSTMLRSSSAFSSTTVLATDRLRPITRPVPKLQPHSEHRPMPSRVASTIWPIAPGIAMPLTASRSEAEKCRPTPNISRMTPTSASCDESPASATKPGV